MAAVFQTIADHRRNDLQYFVTGCEFIESDLLTDEAHDSYRAMSILLDRQEQQLNAMVETAMLHKAGFTGLCTALGAVQAARDDVNYILHLHTLAKNAKADAEKAAKAAKRKALQ